MAVRKTQLQQQERIPTKLIVNKSNFKDDLNTRIHLGEDIYSIQILKQSQLDAVQQDYYEWDDWNSELLKQSFNNENNEYKKEYDSANIYYGLYGSGQQDEVLQFKEKLQNKIGVLKNLVAKVDLIKSDIISNIGNTSGGIVNNDDIFIVHGHNNEIKTTVARTLEKLGLNPIILHEQPNAGKTIIEKFEEHSNVGFAIILLTDDDLGKPKKNENMNSRARQNVILELGYFIGKLGRNKVCPLYTKGVELPSDLYGLLYIEIDQSEYWKINMAKELKAAGYDVDVNKII